MPCGYLGSCFFWSPVWNSLYHLLRLDLCNHGSIEETFVFLYKTTNSYRRLSLI